MNKGIKQQRIASRQVGRRWLVDLFKQFSGTNLTNKRNAEIVRWAKSHSNLLPEECRDRLLQASVKNFIVELGFFLRGKPVVKQTAIKKKRRSGGDAFYLSWEWKKARFEILKKFGPKCMLCGATERIVVDHIKPRRRYPALELDLENLQVLCDDCNRGKSYDDETDFRPRVAESEWIELEMLNGLDPRMH